MKFSISFRYALAILWLDYWKAATSVNGAAAVTVSVVADDSFSFLFLDSTSAGTSIPPLKQTNMS